MASFLSRLFRSRQVVSVPIDESTPIPCEYREKLVDFSGSDQVRILLFRERCGQERRLLFDSKAIRKRTYAASHGTPKDVHKQIKDNSIENSFKLNTTSESEYIYECQKSSSDGKMLREMIFGSVSITYSGTAMKVHSMRASHQIMISAVFPAPPLLPLNTDEKEQDLEASICSVHSSIEAIASKSCELSLAHSVPFDVPGRKYRDHTLLLFQQSSPMLDESSYASLPVDCRLVPLKTTLSLPRSGSYNNLYRRLLRNKATSMEFGVNKSLFAVPSVVQIPIGNSYESEHHNVVAKQDRVKLGLSVILSLKENEQDEKQFQDFLFAHITLIESHILELKETVLEAYVDRKNFLHLMYEGSKKLQLAIEDLCSTPRLQFPTWLTIISSPNHQDASAVFLQKFATVLKLYDRKETNFFVSTLLTAVLTHHLSWVSTVIPSEAKATYSKHILKHTPVWVETLVQSRPYNPLWVQLRDLFGVLSLPYKFAKTVVVGSKHDIVMNILHILSYFIRCSDIFQRLDEQRKRYEDDMRKVKDEVFHQLKCSYITDVSNLENFHRQQFSDISNIKDYISNNILKNISSNCDCELMINNILSNIHSTVNHGDNQNSLGYDSMEFAVEESKLTVSSNDVDININNLKDPSEKENETFKNNDTYVTTGNMHLHGNCSKNEKHNFNYAPSDSGCSTTSKESGSLEEENSLFVYNFSQKPFNSFEEKNHNIGDKKKKIPKRGTLSMLIEAYDNWAPEGLQEVPLPKLKSNYQFSNSSLFKSFGWSLMAGLTDHYLSDFCLQGVIGKVDEKEIREDLIRSTKVNLLGDTISEALCIVANLDTCTVELLSSEKIEGDVIGSSAYHIGMSSLVSSTCDSLLEAINSKVPIEACMIHLEDKLQEIYFQSLTLADFLSRSNYAHNIDRVASAIDCNTSDIRLLLSVALIHTPHIYI